MTLLDNATADLNKYHKILIDSFGGIDSFLESIYNKYLENTDRVIYDILSHPADVKVIVPPAFSFYLESNNDLFLEKPYSVFNKDGEILYKVTNHDGVFGNSMLDRALILQSQPLDYYYLQFDTYQGSNTTMLIMGLLSRDLTRKINPKLRDIETESEITQPNNYLNIYSNNVLTENNDFVTDYKSIQLYFTPTTPLNTVSLNDLRFNPLTQMEIFDVNFSKVMQFYFEKSGFIFFSQATDLNELVYLKPTILKGQGTHRFIKYSEQIYYLALASEMNLDIVKQSFELLDQELPSFEDSYQSIQIDIELNL
jgi:hypothetical protein